MKHSIHRPRNRPLGLAELIAIAIGGMVGGGIFSILGISVALIGNLTPIAIFIGGMTALLAAYSYVKLGVYYKDEGATYSFIKKTFPKSHYAASSVGWYIIFGYISTLALYAYTFSAYTLSNTEYSHDEWVRKAVAWAVIWVFAGINLWSVKGMGKIEDLMVYTKIVLLILISIVLIRHGQTDLKTFAETMVRDFEQSGLFKILIVAAVTFVAYEGFQLVINAVNEMVDPDKNIPRAIYSAIILVIITYVVLAIGALLAIPKEQIIRDKEYALAAGAQQILGPVGAAIVIAGAILATSSAISSTVFGSSRQMAVIAEDGYFPAFLTKRRNHIPYNAIITMSVLASLLILTGGLEMILEFGSITFLLVSWLVAYANHKIRTKTRSSAVITTLAVTGLGISGLLILYYEFTHKPERMWFTLSIYAILSLGAWLYAKRNERKHSEAVRRG